MNLTLAGIAIGAFLAFMAFSFGFWGFLIAAIFMGAGALVGRAASGKMQWRSVLDAITGRRSSS
ncbi:membrane protein [Arthrobacter sp. 35W]|uniref:membrane protein n=1 Tax=Arthrobacter sp. 35W TaxID=1132441 RepID=UPI000411ED02|nr:membrane protein [Arthrobacter sp. 35W]